jgi:signal transduction histidine kinase
LRANTGRLSRLIEDLLDVDRLASGLVTANREPHDLVELVHRVIDGPPLAGRYLDVDLQPITASVDPVKLERVVANLLANAVRHTPAGARVRITVRRTDGATLLVVEDDGPGVDPTHLEQIFEPFVQAPAQHDAPQPGTGLGLTLTREFVALHGGRITATNRPGGGIRFEVVLPDEPDEPGRI